MDIYQLRIFYTVAVNGSFSKAASQLYLAQPTVTKNIQALEKDVGVKLIERSCKHFSLTREGERLLTLTEDILARFDDIGREFSDIRKSNTGDITLAGPPLSLAVYFPNILKLIRERHPGINISIAECGSKTAVEMVCAGKADIGISQMPVVSRDVDVYPIIRDRCILLVNAEHPLSERKSISIAQLVDEKFISLAQGFVMHDTVQNICRAAGFTPNIVFHTSLISFAEKLVSLGEGVSILPRPLVGTYPSDGVRTVEIDEYIPWDAALVTSNRRYKTPAAQTTLGLALDYFGADNSAKRCVYRALR